MRATAFFLSTLKEAPAEAELVSHKLMMRAGLIKKLGSGLYTWMPLGLRVLRKVERVVREEMDRSGAVELVMPAVQPAELWQESGRWDKFGPQMLRIKDRHERDYCFGPTHEEVITDIARKDIRSYRQLPVNFYQIQTKFRDEIRPRFGVMRAREFIMKDAYSFHGDYADLEREYRNMYDTYSRIFERLGLRFRPVAADTGAIGGTGSHEFHVLADSGEDAIAFSPESDYAANVELAEALPPSGSRAAPAQPLQKIATPGAHTIEDVSKLLQVGAERIVKTLMIVAGDGQEYLLLLRGDHMLNELKADKRLPAPGGFRFATDAEIRQRVGAGAGSIGPIGLALPVLADRALRTVSDFVCGANEDGFHFTGVNFGRDLPEPAEYFDIRNVVEGDPSPDGKGRLQLCRGIEVGHIFQLRTKYSEAMGCTFLDDAGQTRPMEMGCYGIGVSRIVAAAIEQNNDARGIVWPLAIAPFQVAIAPVGWGKSEQVRAAAQRLYDELSALGLDVLLDDRDERPGVMFAELELIGIPHRITVGERSLKQGQVEYQPRGDASAQLIDLSAIVDKMRSLCVS
jgi:prolyl-tRNA synthetase